MKFTPEVWKWISAVLVSIVVSMAGYIISIENVITEAVNKEIVSAMAVNLEPVRARVGTLEERSREARIDHIETDRKTNRLEASLSSIDARLTSISSTQSRILNSLEAMR